MSRQRVAESLKVLVPGSEEVDQATVSKWETGETAVRVEDFELLAQIYGTTADRLFFPPAPTMSNSMPTPDPDLPAAASPDQIPDLRRNLDRALMLSGRSSREVSLAAGLSDSGIKHILAGRSKNPRCDTIAAIERALGIPANSLLGHDFPCTDSAPQLGPLTTAGMSGQPCPGDPIADLDEAVLLGRWRTLSITKKAALFDHLGIDDLPSLVARADPDF